MAGEASIYVLNELMISENNVFNFLLQTSQCSYIHELINIQLLRTLSSSHLFKSLPHPSLSPVSTPLDLSHSAFHKYWNRTGWDSLFAFQANLSWFRSCTIPSRHHHCQRSTMLSARCNYKILTCRTTLKIIWLLRTWNNLAPLHQS